MSAKKVFPWIEKLHEVGDPIRAARESIDARVQQAEQMEEEAAALRALAYFDSLELMTKVKQLWTEGEIAQAQGLALIEQTRTLNAAGQQTRH